MNLKPVMQHERHAKVTISSTTTMKIVFLFVGGWGCLSVPEQGTESLPAASPCMKSEKRSASEKRISLLGSIKYHINLHCNQSEKFLNIDKADLYQFNYNKHLEGVNINHLHLLTVGKITP